MIGKKLIMNRKIVLIQSHCNSDDKKKYLLKNIEKLREYDVDILLFSHITLPEEIISKVDYFVYDKSNPILYSERRHWYWWANETLKLETFVPDYGWTVFNQIIKSYNLVNTLNYDFYYIFCYDLIIDDTVKDALNNPKTQIYKHTKGYDTNSITFDASLVFANFSHEDFKKIISSLSKSEYIERHDLIAEKYFEIKLKENDIYNNFNLTVRDFFNESDDIFNISKNKKYELFLDTKNPVKLRLIKKTDEDIEIVINDDIFEVTNDYFIIDKNVDEIKTLGCLINSLFDDWKIYFEDKRENVITIKK